MALQIEVQGNKFRVITPAFATDWLPDTPGNRKVIVIMLRSLQDENGKALFTLQELSVLLDSGNRQAASQHLEDFRDCGEDFCETLKRKQKVDDEVVSGVQEILRQEPLLKKAGIVRLINEKLGREDITEANVDAALEQISCKEIRRILQKQLANGQAHYKEEYLVRCLFEMAIEKAEEMKQQAPTHPKEAHEQWNQAAQALGVESGQTEQEAEPELSAQAKELFEEGKIDMQKLSCIWDNALGWKLWAFVLYYHGVSLSAIGGWMGVNKSTVCRWLKEVSDWASPYLKDLKLAFSGCVAIDEKWIKIGNCVWYLFVAVDCVTGCPLHLAIYPSNSGNYCKLFLLALKSKGYSPKSIITDGWDGYIKAIHAVFPDAEHLLCRFHVIRSVFRRIRKAKLFKQDLCEMVGKLFRTCYKRTVERRIEKLKAKAASLQSEHVLSGLLRKLPQVLKAVGSTWRPSTSNAVEQFFSKFDRFYRLKGPFCDEASARKHMNLFLLGYLFSIGAQGQASPLEKASGNVVQMPFYHLLNRPNIVALKDRIAQQYRAVG